MGPYSWTIGGSSKTVVLNRIATPVAMIVPATQILSPIYIYLRNGIA